MTRRRVIGWAATGLAAWVVLGLLGAYRVGPLLSLAMTMMLVVTIAAAHELIRALPTNPVMWRSHALVAATPREDAPDFRLRTLPGDVADGAADGARVHLTLSLLSDERLATKHGVDRQRDPEAATRLLGDDLATYLSGTRGFRATTSQLSEYISRIEAL